MKDQSSPSKSNGQKQKNEKLKQNKDMSKTVDGSVSGQVEVKQTVPNKSFDDLPSVMLEAILKKLGVSSLLSCRPLNRRFNEISSELLKSRALIQVEQKFNNKLFVRVNIQNQSLEKLIECFKVSKNFPCSRYHFQLRNNLNQEDFTTFTNFISSCSSQNPTSSIVNVNVIVKSLDLELLSIDSATNLTQSIKILQDLLFNKLPNLVEFGLSLDSFSLESNCNLFPSPSKKIKGPAKSFQLAQLKILRLSPSVLQKLPYFVKDLLEAAVNLEKIEPFSNADCYSFSKIEQFQFFHSNGKLELLQGAKISPSVDLVSWVKTKMKEGNPAIFKLTKLTLKTFSGSNEPSILSDTKIFIKNLLESIKQSLRELKVEDLKLVENVDFPKFQRLRELSAVSKTKNISAFAVGFLTAENLPALQKLHLSVRGARIQFPLDDLNTISVMPTLKSVSLSRCQVTAVFIQELAMMCPNLTKLKIVRVSMIFSTVGPSIWTHVTKLKSLSLLIFGDYGINSMKSIVSAFTGFPQENCRLALKESLKMSEAEMEELRENSSILDLKELKTLSVRFDSAFLLPKAEERCIQICKIYAFDYIPNLIFSTRVV